MFAWSSLCKSVVVLPSELSPAAAAFLMSQGRAGTLPSVSPLSSNNCWRSVDLIVTVSARPARFHADLGILGCKAPLASRNCCSSLVLMVTVSGAFGLSVEVNRFHIEPGVEASNDPDASSSLCRSVVLRVTPALPISILRTVSGIKALRPGPATCG